VHLVTRSPRPSGTTGRMVAELVHGGLLSCFHTAASFQQRGFTAVWISIRDAGGPRRDRDQPLCSSSGRRFRVNVGALHLKGIGQRLMECAAAPPRRRATATWVRAIRSAKRSS